MGKKSETGKRQSSTPRRKAHFRRDAVVAALGEAAEYGLPESYFVRRGHIMRAYGFSSREVSVLVEVGTLEEVRLQG